MLSLSATTAALAASAAFLQGADAHGYLSQPQATFVNNWINTTYAASFTANETGLPSFQSRAFNMSPANNAAQFWRASFASRLASLRTLLDKFVPDCGNTLKTVAPIDVSGMDSAHWQNDEHNVGFIASHAGPCELWIDDTRVFRDNNCAAHYTTYPASMPVDYSKCSGSCLLRFYWLALHEEHWQAYTNCAPITNGLGGSGASTSTNSVSQRP